MVRDAIRSSGLLDGHNLDVYSTGSYRNNTNIRLGSDVDIAVVLRDAFYYRLPAGRSPEEFGLGQGTSYGMGALRRDLGLALRDQFGADVEDGDTTFKIDGNSYRLPADATPFLRHRAYTGKRLASGSWEYYLGVETRPVSAGGRRIVNWHEQHYKYGVDKNKRTNRRFKRVARILKRLRDDMLNQGTAAARAAADPAVSFLLECLAFNADDARFNIVDGSYYEDVRAVVRATWNATKDDAAAQGLVEVNRMKRLFGPHQKWTRAQAHEFLLRAWQHVGFS